MANKKYELTQSVTSNYAGQEAQGYISASLLSGTTLSEGNLTVLNNVKYKANLRKITVAGTAGNLMADASCNFIDSGTVTYAERVLTPKDLDVNTEVCKKEFIQTWEGANMTAGLNGTLPLDFSDYLISQTAERVSAEIEQSIWDGNGTNNGQFDGFKLLLSADGTVNTVAGTTITALNVVDEIQKVVDATPNAVYGKEDFGIYVPTSALKFFVQSQATLGYANLYNMNSDFAFIYNGVPIKHAPGLADDTMVAGRKSNMFFGIDGSRSEVRLLDMSDLDGSDNVRIVMRFATGVNYAFGSDMVLYS
tara:strand:- start:4652 stop:5572 length:921 start_codon:yes stop_codon:yes gene_type:complete